LSTWQAKIVAAIGAMALASAPLGISLGGSAVFILSDYSKTLLLFFLLVAAIRNTRDLVVIAWGFVLGCAYLVYLSLFFYSMTITQTGLMRLNSVYMFDANDINSILLIGFGLIGLFVQTSKGLVRYGGLLLMLGIGATAARSGSRGGFVGLAVVGAALLISLNRVSVAKRIGFVGLVGLGLALYAPPGYWQQMNTILTPEEDYNWTAVDGRKQIWTRGVGYMLEYPIGGLGINNFGRAECTISDKALQHEADTGIKCIAPHNTYLQMGAELGFPGLALWVTMVFGSILKMRTLAKRVPRQWERGDFEARFLFYAPRYLQICMLGFAVTSSFVSHAYLDPVYILVALMAGTHIAVAERLRREQPATASAGRR
jgi:O-antigen ligase